MVSKSEQIGGGSNEKNKEEVPSESILEKITQKDIGHFSRADGIKINLVDFYLGSGDGGAGLAKSIAEATDVLRDGLENPETKKGDILKTLEALGSQIDNLKAIHEAVERAVREEL